MACLSINPRFNGNHLSSAKLRIFCYSSDTFLIKITSRGFSLFFATATGRSFSLDFLITSQWCVPMLLVSTRIHLVLIHPLKTKSLCSDWESMAGRHQEESYKSAFVLLQFRASMSHKIPLGKMNIRSGGFDVQGHRPISFVTLSLNFPCHPVAAGNSEVYSSHPAGPLFPGPPLAAPRWSAW